MFERRYLFCAEWLNILMLIMLYYVSLGFLYFATGLEPSRVFFSFVVLVIVFSYLQRVYVRVLPVYILLHLLEFAVSLLLPMPLFRRAILVFILILFAMADLSFWSGSRERSFIAIPSVSVLWFAFVFAYASVKGAPELGNTAYVCGILFLCAFFLRSYFSNALHFIVENGSDTKDMLRQNERLVFPLVACFAAGMFLIKSKSLADALAYAVRMILKGIAVFVSFIFSLFPASVGEEAAEGAAATLELAPSQEVLPEWLIVALIALEKVLGYLFAAFIVYLILKLIIRFIRMYFIRFGYDLTVAADDGHTEKREWLVSEEKKKPGRLRRLLSYSGRIRYKYKRSVERLKRQGYPFRADHTPAERLADVISRYPEHTDDFGKLSHEYEIIRYSE
ncbi:MAG: DUF4129 domain-containing protein [Lachnospiraceae bacterium]|nr:DUF4129 domain-containing protein [Lachnospiraceae bacterium]